MEFDKVELDLTKKIISTGLEKAVESMAFFTKEEMKVNSLEVKIRPFPFLGNLLNKSSDEEFTLLTSEIKGEVNGVCYLIFSKDEVDEILNVSLPASILNDPEKMKMMGDAMLLEMDNIVVASVITALSNALKNSMYGNVPAIQKTDASGLMDIFEGSKKTGDYFLYFKSEFKSNTLNMNPDFIWFLDDNYEQGLKKLVRENNQGLN